MRKQKVKTDDPIITFINTHSLAGIVADIGTNIKKEFDKRVLPCKLKLELFDFDGDVKLCIIFPVPSLDADALVELESELFNKYVDKHFGCGRIVFQLSG